MPSVPAGSLASSSGPCRLVVIRMDVPIPLGRKHAAWPGRHGVAFCRKTAVWSPVVRLRQAAGLRHSGTGSVPRVAEAERSRP